MVINAIRSRAKATLQKYHPMVIAVTGSMGKTSTKNAIEVVLADSVRLRSSEKNFNNEIGVPLTILGEASPGRSIFGWVGIWMRSFQKKDYPEVLLLEFGADHPGDIQALCELAPPTIGVVTGISTVHAEYFANIDELAAEKSALISSLPADGLAVLNADDERTRSMASKSKAKVVTYGLKSTDISAQNVLVAGRTDDSFEPGEALSLTRADVIAKDAPVGALELKNLIGYAPVMSCLAAIAVAERFGIAYADAIARLNAKFAPVPGRLRPLPGIKGSLIIDDSYNAAPAAMINGLEILRIFSPGEQRDRRIAVLGQMVELGEYTAQEHRMVGLKVAEVADLFLAVGESMRVAVDAAKEAGMEADKIEWFATSEEAGRYLDRVVQAGDIIYVKGSQSSRMEKVVKDVMAEPLMAKDLIVRQEEKWLNS